MANRIDRFHKLGKQNINRSDITTSLLTVPVSISNCHNTKDKNIYMTLKSTFTTTTSSTTTAAVHYKPDDTIEK